MLIQLKSGIQLVLEIAQDSLANGRPLRLFPEVNLNSLNDDENIFFTYIDRQHNSVSGYKLTSSLVAVKLWQLTLD